MQSQALLDVRDLRTNFYTAEGVVQAVRGISFKVARGEVLGIVGESGCGKTVTGLSLLRLVRPPGKIVSGQVLFDGRDLLALSDREVRMIRGKEIAMIFQDPMASLNPVLSIGLQMTEMLREHTRIGRRAARDRAVELLKLVGIPDARQSLDRYPHQLSGGMRQRVMIATALSCEPKLLIADEPTTALDVTIQAQILELLTRLHQELGMATIIITHNLGLLAGIADRVQVMYAGHIVEKARVHDIYRDPRHPYTLGLLNCVPRLDTNPDERLKPIEGAPPSLLNPSVGCPFQPRCEYRVDKSAEENPRLRRVGEEHFVACWVDVPPEGHRPLATI